MYVNYCCKLESCADQIILDLNPQILLKSQPIETRQISKQPDSSTETWTKNCGLKQVQCNYGNIIWMMSIIIPLLSVLFFFVEKWTCKVIHIPIYNFWKIELTQPTRNKAQSEPEKICANLTWTACWVKASYLTWFGTFLGTQNTTWYFILN